MKTIGEHIRFLRKSKNLTLKNLAFAASMSYSFLSEIENNKTNASISVLKRIAKALNVSFTDLLIVERRTLVRKNERRLLVHSEGSRISWYALSSGIEKKMGPILGVLDEGANSGATSVGHIEGEEFVTLLSGRLEFKLGTERFILEEGDSLYYDATIPHSYRNLNNGTTVMLAITTPQTF